MTQHGMSARSAERKPSPLFELANVLVRLDHVARIIINRNHSTVLTAAKLRALNGVADCVWLAISQAGPNGSASEIRSIVS